MSENRYPELGEAIGTFFLVLVGGAAIVTGQSGFVVACAFGGVLVVLVYALGPLCGAHFNPAITLGFAAIKHFPVRRVLPYVIAQLVGALGAVLALRWMLPRLGTAGPGVRLDSLVAVGSVEGLPAVVVEVVATFLLAFVIAAVATDRRVPAGVSGIAIGGTVFVGALVAGPLTGAAMNPARALAPMLVTSEYTQPIIHIVAPIVGAVAGMFAYHRMRTGSSPTRPLAGQAPSAEAK